MVAINNPHKNLHLTNEAQNNVKFNIFFSEFEYSQITYM